ncbi:MAG: oligopeptide/dipeptide ABC transporter ATP-binding protein, partial [Thermomicrobiales bacterium]
VTVMRSGEVVEQSDARTFFDRPGKQYSQQLLGAARASFLARAAAPDQMNERTPAALEAKALTVSVRRTGMLTSYHDRMTRIVSDLSMSVARGEVVGLIGESGSGKSTIARAITGLQQISSGTLVLGSSEVTRLNERAARILRRQGAVQMVFQDPYSSLDPLMTVEEIVTEALPASERSGQSTRQHASRLLSLVGLDPAVMTRYPSEFSGGQRQRIAIARALAPNPQILICDEATSALDMSTRKEIIDLLGRLREEMGLSVLFISHDLATIRGIANKTYIMYCGELVECGPSKSVMTTPKHPYTKALIASILEPAISEQTIAIGSRIVGEIPSIHKPPQGCRFHPRCPDAFEACAVEKPVETVFPDGSKVRCHLYNAQDTGRLQGETT